MAAKWANRDERSERQEKIDAWWSADAEKQAGGEGGKRVDWFASHEVQRINNRRLTGSEDKHWLEWLKDDYVKDALERGLSIGCGGGVLERAVLEVGLCRRMEGMDIADGAVEVARKAAEGLPIEYSRVDLESDELPRKTFDIIFSVSTLHHVNRLDFCVGQLHRSLREDGILVLQEFIGPPRFQWDPLQSRLVFDLYSFLPGAYRYNHQSVGMIPYPQRPALSWMVTNYPSEAVRSNEMLHVVDRYFERIDRRALGGTLLNPFLAGILENFEEDKEADLSFIRMVALLEDTLLEVGVRGPDFVLDVYRKRPRPLEDEKLEGGDSRRSERISEQEKAIVGLSREHEQITKENEKYFGQILRAKRKAREVELEIQGLRLEIEAKKSGPLLPGVRPPRIAVTHEDERPEEDSWVPDLSGKYEPPTAMVPIFPNWVDALSSAEAAAIKRFVEKRGSGGEILWLRWLYETGVSGERALMIGIDPGAALAARSTGVCGSVDLATVREVDGRRELVLTWPDDESPSGDGAYDIVVLELSRGYGAADIEGPVYEALNEEGVLVVTSARDYQAGEADLFAERAARVLPADWNRVTALTRESRRAPDLSTPAMYTAATDGQPEAISGPFALVDRKGFGSAAIDVLNALTSYDLPAEDAMMRAVACQMIYLENYLVACGLLPAAVEVRVYRKGSSDEGGKGRMSPGQPPCDIVELQEAEVERLSRLVLEGREYRAHLLEDLGEELENVEKLKELRDTMGAEARSPGKRNHQEKDGPNR